MVLVHQKMQSIAALESGINCTFVHFLFYEVRGGAIALLQMTHQRSLHYFFLLWWPERASDRYLSLFIEKHATVELRWQQFFFVTLFLVVRFLENDKGPHPWKQNS